MRHSVGDGLAQEYGGTPVEAMTGRIAFRSARDDNLEIYVMNDDGSHVINLTNNQALDAGPEWSPAP